MGLEARHSFRRYLIGIASIKYTVNPYDAVSINERDLTTELGFDYYLNRDAIIFARYQHIDYQSTVPAATTPTTSSTSACACASDGRQVRLGVSHPARYGMPPSIWQGHMNSIDRCWRPPGR